MIHEMIDSKRAEIMALGRHYRARKLAVFGSAATENFNPQRSDVDFLVEFAEMPPAEYADAFLGLREALECLLERPVDLLTESSLGNPYLRNAIHKGKRQLYAA